MKLKAMIVLAATAFFAACSSTYRATDTDFVVSADAQRNFELQYPSSTNIVWSSYDPNVVVLNEWDLAGWDALDASDYAVQFDMDGEKYYAWYDQDGNWVGTAYAVHDYTKLPAYINSTLNLEYPNYTIVSVNREFHKDRNAYEVVLKNTQNRMVVIIDDNGNILKSKTKPL